MVRTYNQNNASTLGGVFGDPGHNNYHGKGRRSVDDYDDILNRKRREENRYRNSDPFVGNMKSSTSEGFLSSATVPSTGLDDTFGLGAGLQDLSGALSRLQHAADPEALLGDSAFGGGSYGGSYPTSAANSYGGQHQRHTWSAPNDFDLGIRNGLDSKPDQRQESRRRGGNPNSKSAYRRELQEQMELKKRHDEEERRLDRGLPDPMEHLRHDRNGADHIGYNPSVYNGDHHRRGRRGGNVPPPGGGQSREAYLRELEEQMADQKARREQEERGGGRDWWEKREQRDLSPDKPHPSQANRTSNVAKKKGPQSYKDELQQQMEMKKRQEDEEKRKEREEEEKLERRIQEQQDRMKREYDEEQAKKKAKEDAKIKRQEEMARKQEEMHREAERRKKEEAERKSQARRAAREASQMANAPSSPRPSRQDRDARSDSPPVPSMRGRRQPEQQQEEVLSQLSSMRESLDRKESELSNKHEEHWGGLVEV